MKKRVLVWMSWWVDSAVSAYLLKKEGYDVACWFMKNYVSEEENCPTREDRDEAIKVSQYLWIKEFMIFDFREEYDKKVVQYIYEGYKSWITPNPDILCNSEIKFKIFLEHSMKLWFDYIATWHYARIEKTEADWKWVWAASKKGLKYRYKLLKWVDPSKDQSYFLAWLDNDQLSKSLFPIWHLLKSEVRKIAEEIGLPNAKRKDSQWICFVWKVDMHKFLEKKIPTKNGQILDTNGKVVWEHNWAWFFTIGQRKWIKIWWWPALFVVNKDVEKNVIVVWDEKDLELYSKNLTLRNWHWIGKEYTFPLDCKAKIRYRQEDQDVRLSDIGKWKIIADFANNQRAITSGQILAAYIWDELIWSWVIE